MGWIPHRKEDLTVGLAWLLQCGLSVPLFSEHLNKIQQRVGPLGFLRNDHFSKLSFWK